MKQKYEDMPTAKSGGHKSRNDLIFIGALLTILCVMGLCFYLIREEGNSISVTVNGTHFGDYSLSENITVDIVTGEQGESHNVLVVKDGKAYVESATCPDGICAAHRPISRDRESIVCLPHKVVITVRTVNSDDAPDIIA